MIRVAIILAAIVSLPLAVLAAEPVSGPPARRVADFYYQKRAQAAGAGTAMSAAPQSEAIQQSAAFNAQTNSDSVLTVSGPIPRLPLTPQQAGYNYYLQRQTQQQTSRARLTQYMPGADGYFESEEVTSPSFAPLPSTGGSSYSDDESSTVPPYANTTEGEYSGEGSLNSGDADSCVDNNSCVNNGCVKNSGAPRGYVANGCASDGYCDSDAIARSNCLLDSWNSVPTCNVLWNELYSCRCLWTNFEYLGFWGKGNHLPPLVTSNRPGTLPPPSQAGVLGLPDTVTLFGDQRVNNDMRSGGRFTIGGWLVGDVLGIEGNYFALDTATTDFTATSHFTSDPFSAPILARPFFNPAPPVGPPAQSRDLVAYPGLFDGGVHVNTASAVQSAGLLLRRLVGVNLISDTRMFLVGGYRFFRLEEGLLITDQNALIVNGVPSNNGFTHLDSFGTKNMFNGGDIGLMSDIRRGRWVIETTAKIALGDMYEVVNIDGQTKQIINGTPTGYAGGVLTQPSNMGLYRRNQFSMIPDLNVKLGLQITPGLRATAGYNFMYVTRVARPGNEVDYVVNPPTTPGGPQVVSRPTYLNNPTDFWLQGFTAGLEYRW